MQKAAEIEAARKEQELQARAKKRGILRRSSTKIASVSPRGSKLGVANSSLLSIDVGLCSPDTKR